jgi:muramoyltetrapeptide carboxypeptidase LdcA involved in peptidoglycan recycling
VIDRRTFLTAAALTTLAPAMPATAAPATITFPQPLRKGDVIGITSPSAGVKDVLRPRMRFAYRHLRGLGYRYQEGRFLWGSGLRSGPARARAAELQEMLLDDRIAAVFPPNGGELLIDILPFIDFDVLAAAAPKWVLGYSDMSAFMLPYTLLTHHANLNGTNLWESPINPTDPRLAYWNDVVTLSPGRAFTQRAARLYQPHDSDWDKLPRTTRFDRRTPVEWKCLGHENDPDHTVRAEGRLIGGTLDVIGPLCGSAYGDVRGFGAAMAPSKLLVYLDSCDYTTAQYCRALHQLRFNGWFDHAAAVLIGRTAAATVERFDQRDALRDALDGLPIPVIYDMDIGHLPPQLLLVNGASGILTFSPDHRSVRQILA